MMIFQKQTYKNILLNLNMLSDLFLKWRVFGFFVITFSLVISYFFLIASPRYVSQVQFVVKQVNDNNLAFSGLSALGGSSPSTRDALILQKFIQSIEMATALDKELQLKSHYEDKKWDFISRLKKNSSKEEYLEYFQNRLLVEYDEVSEILRVEVQAYTEELALLLCKELIRVSETFINQLGTGIANSKLQYAEQEVKRSHEILKKHKIRLVEFQNTHQLISPDSEGGVLMSSVQMIESEIVSTETELKALNAYMQAESTDIQALEYRLVALRQQLAEEKQKLAGSKHDSLTKIMADFKSIELNTKLSSDLYSSSLTSLELARADAFKQLKYLLIVELPRLAEESVYPQRLRSVITWLIVLTLSYLVVLLIVSVIKEHRD